MVSSSVAIAAAGEEAFERTFKLGHALAQFGQLTLHVVEALVHLLGESVDAAAQLAALLADVTPQLAHVAPQPSEECNQQGRREPGNQRFHAVRVARAGAEAMKHCGTTPALPPPSNQTRASRARPAARTLDRDLPGGL